MAFLTYRKLLVCNNYDCVIRPPFLNKKDRFYIKFLQKKVKLLTFVSQNAELMESKYSILTDSERFGRFFAEYRDHFVKIAYSYLYDMDAARDIVTDSFVYVWERRYELSSEQNLKGYVYMCVRNRCISWLRERSVRVRIEDELSRSAEWKLRLSVDSLSDNDISDKLFLNEVSEVFRDRMASMPRRTREIFEASRNENMTYKEIALRYGISVRSVTAEIQTALRLLRASLRDYLP